MESKESELTSFGTSLPQKHPVILTNGESEARNVISLAFEPIEGHTSSSFWLSPEDITQQVFSSTHSDWKGTAHGVTIPACLHPFCFSSVWNFPRGTCSFTMVPTPVSPRSLPLHLLKTSHKPQLWMGCNVPEPAMHAVLRPCVG